MNPYDFYITPEEYDRAFSFGVDAHNLERRVRLLGWKKELAITTPLRALTDRAEWVKIAESNGIGYQTFMNRVNNLGWDEDRAATERVMTKKEMAVNINSQFRKNRRIPSEIIRLAESNGIKYHTLRSRIKFQNMDPIEAATKSVMSMRDVQKMGVKAYEKVHGRFNAKVFKS